MNFSEVKRGYDPDEVDNYIESLENVIKSYKEKDNAIKNAIISAQVAADNMIKNAKMQADEYKMQIVRELDKVRTEVERERIKILEFQEMYGALVRKYLSKLDEQDTSRLINCLNEIDRLIDHLTETDLVKNMQGAAPFTAPEFKIPARPLSRQPAVLQEDYDD